MGKKTSAEKAIETITTGMEKWTDEETLEVFGTLLDRVNIGTQFVTDADEITYGEVLVISCGDKQMSSDVMPFPWPMQPVPMPEGVEAN